MHNRHVRNWVIFSIVMVYVVSVRDLYINALLAIWVGAWSMSKLFDPLFGSHQHFKNLAVYDFIPYPDEIAFDMLIETRRTRKQVFFVLLWWSSGILTAFLTYQLLRVLLIPA